MRCKEKQAYGSKYLALRAKQQLQRAYKCRYSVYQCNVCYLWHLHGLDTCKDKLSFTENNQTFACYMCNHCGNYHPIVL